MKNKENIDVAYAQMISDKIIDMLKQKSSEPSDEIKKFIETNEFAPELITRLADQTHYQETLPDKEQSIAQLVNTLNSLKHKQQNRRRKLGYTILWLSSAAIIALGVFIFSPSLFYSKYNIVAQQQSVSTPTIIMSNGENVSLTTLEEKTELDAYTIEKADNKLSYKSTDNKSSAANKPIEYNTIVVPHQYNCNIILDDGTEVILNAMSELRFPVKFSGDNREVFLKGEAYFKVAKSAKPFIVSVENVNVKVYGTEFNIKAYNSDSVEAVLIEGSIGLSVADHKGEVMLSPDNKCVVNTESGKSSVESVNSSEYTYWIDGLFRYDSQTLDQVLHDMSRWYDVDFSFENAKNKSIVITALFQRSDDLEQILLSISEVTSLEFIKEGGVYVIK